MKFDNMDGILDDFVVESQDQLAGVEATLMDMEVRRVAGHPVDREQVDTVFRAFHSVKGTAGFLDLDHVVSVTHEAESLLDGVRQGTSDLTGEHVTALCAALDFTAAALQEIEHSGTDAAMGPAAEEAVRYIASAVSPAATSRPDPFATFEGLASSAFPLDEQEHAETLIDREDPLGREPGADAPVAETTPTPPHVEPAGASAPIPAHVAPVATPPAPLPPRIEAPVPQTTLNARMGESGSRGSIRVDVEKLDQLMNLVGELILAETMVTHNQDLDGLDLGNFTKAARDLNRITRSLQDIAMSVRMVPIGATFQKMQRLVRDLSLKQDKKIELILAGEGTEIDKNLVERIADPLVHMMRNAVDHGIESPADRLAAGKPEHGTIVLEAMHQSGEVWVTIRDDGRGLHKDGIVAKAVERGLIQGGEGMTDAQIFALIFASGFSTADAVSDVSGRGVGMDVVRRNIEEVSGRVDIHSEAGRGTTVTVKIPLTLAIIDGMLVRVGPQIYTLPLLNIKESLQGRPGYLTQLPDGREMVNIRGQILPLIRLSEVFDPTSEPTEVGKGILVVCNHGGRSLCLLVEELLGQRQTVIKGLPTYLGTHAGFSGCSILSSGNISLIVDLGALTHRERVRNAA